MRAIQIKIGYQQTGVLVVSLFFFMANEHLNFFRSRCEIPLSSGIQRAKSKPSETGFWRFQIGIKTAPL
jgi:hypothetical protein